MESTLEADDDHGGLVHEYEKGVKELFDAGISKLPSKYILPPPDRPVFTTPQPLPIQPLLRNNLKLPIIDLAQLQGPDSSQALQALASACEEYGFFQLVNHGIESHVTKRMMDVGRGFFNQPLQDRAKYMSDDMWSAVRYGTSMNQKKDSVFCWRDFLKLSISSAPKALWPTSPPEFRQVAATYSRETKSLFLKLMEATMKSLGLRPHSQGRDGDDVNVLKELEDGSQLLVVNYYPPCPEPHLTLGMSPHSDYAFLTLLLQDPHDPGALQVHLNGQWFTVHPAAGSFIVNVGDHLEIFSNGRYKSVVHRVLANSAVPRISVATLHTLAFDKKVRPASELVGEDNPRRYKDTDFVGFLNYASSREPKGKEFLESRKIVI